MNTSNDLPKIDEESWGKLPERIYPIRYFREFAGALVRLAILGIIWVVYLFVLGVLGWKRITNVVEDMKLLGFFLLSFAGLGFITFTVGNRLIKHVNARSKFQKNQAQAVARILGRRISKYSDSDGTTFFYWLQLEFNPTAASNSTGLQQFNLETDKEFYESLSGKDTINVIYATEDPRVFLIEGE